MLLEWFSVVHVRVLFIFPVFINFFRFFMNFTELCRIIGRFHNPIYTINFTKSHNRKMFDGLSRYVQRIMCSAATSCSSHNLSQKSMKSFHPNQPSPMHFDLEFSQFATKNFFTHQINKFKGWPHLSNSF